MLEVLILVVIFACIALLHSEGMWSNAIRFINTVTAGLLAMNFFEPLAKWLEQTEPAYASLWDFVSLWGLFIVFSLIFRILTDRISKVKVRFSDRVDRIGSGVFALWVAWVFVCFAMVTMHTAPLARNCLRDGFQPEERMFLGLAPDRQWLAFTQKMSLGPYDHTNRSGQKTVFDPHGEFMLKYATRRTNIENNVKKGGSFMMGP
ncbi:MAG: CvpA family protein [Thermoguttaceae bacterium]